MTRPVLVACGVLREARIAQAAGGVVAVAGGGDGDWLEARLAERAGAGAGGVMSFGLCGALVDGLAVGDVVIGAGIAGGVACDGTWRQALRARRRPLRPSGTSPRGGGGRFFSPFGGGDGEADGGEFGPGALVIGVDRLVASAAAKAALHAATGAVVIDMESHIAARVAARHGLPFAIVRVVSDTAADTLPPAFAVAMRRGGGTDVGAILRSLATRPGQIPDFARASANATRALGVLRRVGRLLGPRLGLPDLRERL